MSEFMSKSDREQIEKHCDDTILTWGALKPSSNIVIVV